VGQHSASGLAGAFGSGSHEVVIKVLGGAIDLSGLAWAGEFALSPLMWLLEGLMVCHVGLSIGCLRVFIMGEGREGGRKRGKKGKPERRLQAQYQR
jgi:hypothetical protein